MVLSIKFLKYKLQTQHLKCKTMDCQRDFPLKQDKQLKNETGQTMILKRR